MSKKVEEIIHVVMELSLEERAQLAGTLLSSLDEASESEVERLWLEEAERRLFDKKLLFNGKSIKQEKDRIREIYRAKGKGTKRFI